MCIILITAAFIVTQGPQGIVFEVTPKGEEVWRYISPVINLTESDSSALAYIRQGDTDISPNLGRRSLFW